MVHFRILEPAAYVARKARDAEVEERKRGRHPHHAARIVERPDERGQRPSAVWSGTLAETERRHRADERVGIDKGLPQSLRHARVAEPTELARWPVPAPTLGDPAPGSGAHPPRGGRPGGVNASARRTIRRRRSRAGLVEDLRDPLGGLGSVTLVARVRRSVPDRHLWDWNADRGSAHPGFDAGRRPRQMAREAGAAGARGFVPGMDGERATDGFVTPGAFSEPLGIAISLHMATARSMTPLAIGAEIGPGGGVLFGARIEADLLRFHTWTTAPRVSSGVTISML